MPSARVSAAPYFGPFLLDSKVVVRAATGLEQLVASEVAESGHSVDALSKRQLAISPASGSILSCPLCLADDLFVVTAETSDPGPGRLSLSDAAESLYLGQASRVGLPASPTFAVSASFGGHRNYSRFDIEGAVGRALSRHGVGTYASRRDGAIPPRDAAQWRVTFDGSMMRVGLRPFSAPLHRRRWRARTVLGSLHPPVAAAMALLSGIDGNYTVVDPFCGAGTILIEAHTYSPAATFIGLDVDPRAIATARHNSVGLPIGRKSGNASEIDA